MHLCLFQFFLRDQASNWLKRLPAGSISTREGLTTRFLSQLFPPVRAAKLRNDILMFQQHQGESISKAWTSFKDLLQKVPHHGIDLWIQLRDRNAKESWALLEDLALHDNKSWNDPRDFAKPVKAISLPQDVPSTSDRHLVELENQIQHLMEAHLDPKQPVQVNEITSLCSAVVPTTLSTALEISSKLLSNMRHRVPTKREASGALSNPSKTILVTPTIRHGKVTQTLGLVSNFMASQDARLSKFKADFKQQQSEMTNKIDTDLKAITDRITGALLSDTVKNPKLNVNSTSLVFSASSYPMEDPQCSSHPPNSINAVKTCSKEINHS
ncbi:MAK10-like protein [Tanacetum coccineum]